MKAITDYWHKYYVNKGLCSLCGNHGIIDTIGIRTPAGVLVGRINFCICPNGQAMRKNKKKMEAHINALKKKMEIK